MTRELWSAAQAAEAMGCSVDTVRRLIRSGQLPAMNLSVRMTRIDPADVQIYMESRRIKVAALQRKQRTRQSKKPRGGLNNSGYYPGMKVV